LLLKKGIKEFNATGDGTGYLLTVKKNHMRRNLRTKSKRTEMMIRTSNQQKKRKTFAYSFRLKDLKTKMAFGSSMKSKKEVFDRAMMLSHINTNTARLDKYYSTVYMLTCLMARCI